MLVAAAFANAGDADKVARALSRYGLRALPAISGAQLLRQSASITLVVCGPRLQDMTARRLRQLLPPSIPMLMMAAGETSIPGTERLPCGITKSQQVKPAPHSAWRNCAATSGGRESPKQACNSRSSSGAPPASRAISNPRRASMLTKRGDAGREGSELTAVHSSPPSPERRRGRGDYFFLNRRTTMHSSMKAASPQPP